MTIAWITTSGIHVEAVRNSLVTACEHEFVPTDLSLIETPGASEKVDTTLEIVTSTIEAYGGDVPEICVDTVYIGGLTDVLETH